MASVRTASLFQYRSNPLIWSVGVIARTLRILYLAFTIRTWRTYCGNWDYYAAPRDKSLGAFPETFSGINHASEVLRSRDRERWKRFKTYNRPLHRSTHILSPLRFHSCHAGIRNHNGQFHNRCTHDDGIRSRNRTGTSRSRMTHLVSLGNFRETVLSLHRDSRPRARNL